MDTRRARMAKGQAMVELAIGMFLVAFVVAAVFTFAEYITGAMDEMGEYRHEHAGRFLKYIID